jgi:hypothetical protein
MTESKLDIRSGTLFPWHFQLIAAFILIAGVTLIVGKPVMGSVLIVAAGFILTAASGTEIEPSKNRYREYTSFYFILKSGKWKKYYGAEKIFINSSKKSSQMHTAHTNHSAVFTDQEFNGYLKLNEGTKIHLLTSRKKEKLAASLNKAASFLHIPLQDNTVGNT